MGFFNSLGMDIGHAHSRAVESGNFIPITKINRVDFEEEASAWGRAVPEHVEGRADAIAQTLLQEFGSSNFITVQYVIREIIRNVFEHSQSSEMWYCAQNWPTKNQVNAVISDFGVGIAGTLRSRSEYSELSDTEALDNALLSGVTSAPMRDNGADRYFNTGYGLYAAKRICEMSGVLCVFSGSAAVRIARGSYKKFECNIPGTIVSITLEPSKISNLSAFLASIASEGQRSASMTAGAYTGEASSASRNVK
ncbi:hypothetical protein SAMN06273572_104158 [Monaibacterium marinum]|uniref:Histidine kinase/HSP90-like ATPase domain-containing protein n=2 Tax=Pontivivens marinum TaxID=1690039 RepID=A0A2C9CVP3_9RHOB|nr:hypothetical protein SAMN06273572_104158 [Monaibacterium marinum]